MPAASPAPFNPSNAWRSLSGRRRSGSIDRQRDRRSAVGWDGAGSVDNSATTAIVITVSLVNELAAFVCEACVFVVIVTVGMGRAAFVRGAGSEGAQRRRSTVETWGGGFRAASSTTSVSPFLLVGLSPSQWP